MDVFNYECEGQISLFSGFLTEQCDTKPEIGTELIFHDDDGKDYECVVDAHCGYDFFHVEFLNESPSEYGWHISLRGYGKRWDFKEKNSV